MPSQFGGSKMKICLSLPSLPSRSTKPLPFSTVAVVFGDLRNRNIIYIKRRDGDSTEDRVMLVDFDWAGPHDVDRYPATLNILGGWAEAVFPHAIMLKVDDEKL